MLYYQVDSVFGDCSQLSTTKKDASELGIGGCYLGTVKGVKLSFYSKADCSNSFVERGGDRIVASGSCFGATLGVECLNDKVVWKNYQDSDQCQTGSGEQSSYTFPTKVCQTEFPAAYLDSTFADDKSITYKEKPAIASSRAPESGPGSLATASKCKKNEYGKYDGDCMLCSEGCTVTDNCKDSEQGEVKCMIAGSSDDTIPNCAGNPVQGKGYCYRPTPFLEIINDFIGWIAGGFGMCGVLSGGCCWAYFKAKAQEKIEEAMNPVSFLEKARNKAASSLKNSASGIASGVSDVTKIVPSGAVNGAKDLATGVELPTWVTGGSIDRADVAKTAANTVVNTLDNAANIDAVYIHQYEQKVKAEQGRLVEQEQHAQQITSNWSRQVETVRSMLQRKLRKEGSFEKYMKKVDKDFSETVSGKEFGKLLVKIKKKDKHSDDWILTPRLAGVTWATALRFESVKDKHLDSKELRFQSLRQWIFPIKATPHSIKNWAMEEAV